MSQAERKPFLVPRGTTLPPPLPGVRHVRVPLWGIVIADDRLRQRVDDRFHWPMIVLALAILPLFLIEFIDKPTGWFQLAVDVGFAIIWLAFVMEFAIKIAIAESRFEYCRRNWIDIVVILLPFLRVFRVARLARTSRVFRLRGVGMKFGRHVLTVVLGLQATERMLQRFGVQMGDRRKDPRRMTRYELMDEVKKLRRQVRSWEAWHEAQKQFLAEHGGEPLPEGPALDDGPETAEDEPPEEGPPSERADQAQPAKMAAEARSVRRPV